MSWHGSIGRGWLVFGLMGAGLLAPAAIVQAGEHKHLDKQDGRSRAVRIEAQRGHAICPLDGVDSRTLVLDSAAQFAAVLGKPESESLGRKVRWRHERVLVHAAEQQPTLGTRLEFGTLQAGRPRLGILVALQVTRPPEGSMTATALSRPCVVAAVTRGRWIEARVKASDGGTVGYAKVDAVR